MLTVQKITQINQLRDLTTKWIDLLTNSQTNQIFLSPIFLLNWLESYGHGQLLSYAFFESDKLIGLAPLFICSDENKLKFIGCKDVSDYLDFIIKPKYQDQVFTLLNRELTSIKIDQVELCSIPETSATLTNFKQLMIGNGWEVTQKMQDVCPIIDLPATWQEYLQSLERKQRHEIKRKWKKLANEQQLIFEVITDPGQVKIGIQDFIALHQKSSVDKNRFWNAEHLQFFTNLSVDLAKHNWLKLYFARVNDERVASMLIFDYNNNYYLYNSGFDPEKYANYSVGNVLTAFTVKDAIENHKKFYDFLRGNEVYKYRFGAKDTKIFDLLLNNTN